MNDVGVVGEYKVKYVSSYVCRFADDLGETEFK